MKILFLLMFLILLSIAFAENLTTLSELSFKDKVFFSPDVAFLWNFQRGFEELYRFTKFSYLMRIDYSLELCERRIGEMEVLISKNKSQIIPVVENEYEMEIDKIQVNMNSSDIFSKFMGPIDIDIKENVTQRLNYNIKVLDNISKNTSQQEKAYLLNAIKKTSNLIDFINKLR